MKLSELFNPNEFAARHLSFGDEAALLEALGEKSMDDFVGNTVPQSIRMPSELDLPEALTEADALAKLKAIAAKNVINKSYIGLWFFPRSFTVPGGSPPAARSTARTSLQRTCGSIR